jgi:hypothetical protein
MVDEDDRYTFLCPFESLGLMRNRRKIAPISKRKVCKDDGETTFG